jgi:hypothetical protein
MQSACAILSFFFPARLYIVFPHFLINDTILEKQSLNTKCVFRDSLQILSETFLILRRSERDMIKYVCWVWCKLPFILVRFYWNLNFLDRFSKKHTNIKCHENPCSGSRVVPCGQAERQTWRSLIVAFRNLASAPKIQAVPHSKHF